VGSVILLSPAWTAVLVLASLAGWVAVAWSEGLGEAWLNAGFALVVTSIMAIMIQAVRVREARTTEQLAAANESKAHALERHAAELESANDSLEAFSYVIAHDLKEPIRGMRVYLEELREGLDAPPEERADLLARTLRTQASLERLVTGLLEWSRMTATPLEPEPIDVAALLDDPTTRAVFDRVLDERRARLLVDHDMPLVEGTPALVRQALANLVLNAARHNARPDAEVKVYAAPDAPRGMVDVVVEDNGPGYPQAVLDRVSGLRDRPSTVKGGFGLAIARRAAQRLGGQLVLANRPDGQGAQAHVLLPRVNPRAAAMQKRVRELV
jgi:signal transduction histidine kinase